jgi:O-acetyl-ADP-ribose deacetylase (regulator of RNase III)
MAKNPLGKWFVRSDTGDGHSDGDTGPTIRALQGDITTQSVDAIVNASNEGLRDGAGVAGAIHKAAGPGLLKECADRYPDGCPTGEARVTDGHALPAKWIIHTVGPRWRGGTDGEPDLLAACYRNSLQAASQIGARTVAFPAISAGIFGYPPDEAAKVAVATVCDFLAGEDSSVDEVILVAYGTKSLERCQRLLNQYGCSHG